jgi:hypothetical protein
LSPEESSPEPYKGKETLCISNFLESLCGKRNRGVPSIVTMLGSLSLEIKKLLRRLSLPLKRMIASQLRD